MKFFATALVAAAYQAQQALGAELGQSCVSGVLGKVFARINHLRHDSDPSVNTEDATRYTNDVVGGAGFAASPAYWTMLQNGVADTGKTASVQRVTVQLGKERITQANYQLTKVNAQTGWAPRSSRTVDLSWAEGLALGNVAYVTEWTAAVASPADKFTSLTSTDGTTTASRASANGTVTGAIVEAAYFFKAFSLDATDLMNFIITNDGVNAMRDTLFADETTKRAYKVMSMAIGQDDACTPAFGSAAEPHVPCDTALIVTVAAAYANAAGVAACQPTIAYGGGICDPDAWAGSVWEAMQDARLFPAAVWKPLLTAIAAGCDGMSCTYAWDGSTSAAQTILSSAAGVTAAAAVMPSTALAAFKWYPALFLAAKDQTTYLATAADVASAHGDSTLASRGEKYGVAGAVLVEGIYKGLNSATNTVARLLIDDGDATNLAFRSNFVKADVDQAGAACADHTDKEKVCTVLLGAGFAASAAYEACTTPAVAAAATTPTPAAAMALATAGAAAAALAALF